MGMSDFYGPADEIESVETIHAALEAGVTLFDTGDFYGVGHNELLLRDSLKGRRRENCVLSVKFGVLRGPDGAFLGVDNRPALIKNALAYSLKRLGVEYVDIYRPARVDPSVPIEDVAGAVGDLIKAGYVRHFGLSEAGATTIRRAHAVRPVADVQIEYSIISRSVEREILPTLRELGIGMTAYGVLSRGLLSEGAMKGESASGFRAHLPRFQGENLARNLKLVDALRKIASERGVTVSQLAVAWVLAQGVDIVPLIGARRPWQLAESLEALSVSLSSEEMKRLEAAAPAGVVAGDRYAPDHMATLDSERTAPEPARRL
jgi:aryl-alcohol dehydrogenase-like predicted oxidoreductase